MYMYVYVCMHVHAYTFICRHYSYTDMHVVYVLYVNIYICTHMRSIVNSGKPDIKRSSRKG